jgi:predicted regulator of Ras-like GTPase activity (Roadblock/LC7/MglB family)
MSDPHAGSRSDRLDRAIHALLAQTPEIEAAAVVSFDGLPMASALPPSMDEDRVAAMSAALLSLGERAAQGLGRGELSQVYIEGETGTVFLVSADNEAVLVAVAAQGAKVGMMLYEVRRAAAAVAAALRADDAEPAAAEPVLQAVPAQPEPFLQAVGETSVMPVYTPSIAPEGGWSSSYAPTGSLPPGENPTWS